MAHLVIIHGWSDSSNSFERLADKLKGKLDQDVINLWLGDYISLDDDVRLTDIVAALEMAWHQEIPFGDTLADGVNVIIHSTGGLVIRHWLTNYSNNDKLKLKNIVMLAPANFGSPLAHMGRAVHGRILKGFKAKKRFNTGTQILKSLEMASPYTWDLAFKDLFQDSFLSSNKVFTTVIVGNTGYSGISSIANKRGSDGTVYVSTANLEAAFLRLNFTGNNEYVGQELLTSKAKAAFLVMDEENHGSITLREKSRDGNEALLLKKVLQALANDTKSAFDTWVNDCKHHTQAILNKYENKLKTYKHGYQNTVFHVLDDDGFDIDDYVIEFYQDPNDEDDEFSEAFNNFVVSTVHCYSDNPSYKSFMINCTVLERLVNKYKKPIRISLSALPDYNDKKNVVGYQTFENNDIGYLAIAPEDTQKYFKANRTLLVEITLSRKQKSALFTLKKH